MSRAQRRQKARRLEEKQRHRRDRPSHSPYTRILAIVLAIVFVGGGVVWGAYSLLAGPQVETGVLVVVNGQEITGRELSRRESVIKYLYGLKQVEADLREFLLDDLVEERLVSAEAERRGITVSEEELVPLSEQFEESLRVVHGSPVAITLERLRLRVSAADLVAYQTALVLNRKLYESVIADVTITESDILALYAELKESLDAAGLSLEDARDRLGEEALQKKRGEVYTAFIEELRAQAEISSPG